MGGPVDPVAPTARTDARRVARRRTGSTASPRRPSGARQKEAGSTPFQTLATPSPFVPSPRRAARLKTRPPLPARAPSSSSRRRLPASPSQTNTTAALPAPRRPSPARSRRGSPPQRGDPPPPRRHVATPTRRFKLRSPPVHRVAPHLPVPSSRLDHHRHLRLDLAHSRRETLPPFDHS